MFLNITCRFKHLLDAENPVTIALGEKFGDPVAFKANHPDVHKELKKKGALAKLTVAMKGVVVEPDHIDNFPPHLKEKVREAIVRGLEDDIPLQFTWEIHRGSEEDVEIHDPDDSGRINVVFKTPRSRIKLPEDDADHIIVEGCGQLD